MTLSGGARLVAATAVDVANVKMPGRRRLGDAVAKRVKLAFRLPLGPLLVGSSLLPHWAFCGARAEPGVLLWGVRHGPRTCVFVRS